MTKSRFHRQQDPHLARESTRYEKPLPSREFILEALSEAGEPLDETALALRLAVNEDELPAFSRRLRAMQREGQILRNRKNSILVAGKLELITGRVEGHPDGYGFLLREDRGGADLYLPPSEMQKALHGDRVIARVSGLDRRGNAEASIVEVTERGRKTVVGTLTVANGLAYVEPVDRRITQQILVSHGDCANAKTGDIVVITLDKLLPIMDRRQRFFGSISEVLGRPLDPGMEIEIALRKHDLPFEFSKGALRQAVRIPRSVRPRDIKERVDLRSKPFVTIDGESARDFDDAVWAEKLANGFRLIVAIADVSHYVSHGDPVDLNARERGTSVYLPRKVVPMLPEELSNGICSLIPEEERLCLSCDMEIADNGKIKKYAFYTGVIRSHARLTYEEVETALTTPEFKHRDAITKLMPQLAVLDACFRALLNERKRRGAIDFETRDTQIYFDENGKISRIVPAPRNNAHRLIEECMLAANVSASDYLQRSRHPALFRVHEGPTEEKLNLLRDFLKEFGLHLQGGSKPSAVDYSVLLDQIKKRPDQDLLQTVLLRSLQQARYTPDNVGHFGLSYDGYTHFTSPIRRYPDLLVHRAIKAVLSGEIYEPGDWEQLGMHCSQTERRAEAASREVETWLKCYYMKDRVGEVFSGSVSGVAPFGLFVALDDVYVEGMIHISELGNDYFHFDVSKHQLLGERSAVRYRLADRIKVRIARVDLDSARIDFTLEAAGNLHASKRRNSGRRHD